MENGNKKEKKQTKNPYKMKGKIKKDKKGIH